MAAEAEAKAISKMKQQELMSSPGAHGGAAIEVTNDDEEPKSTINSTEQAGLDSRSSNEVANDWVNSEDSKELHVSQNALPSKDTVGNQDAVVHIEESICYLVSRVRIELEEKGVLTYDELEENTKPDKFVIPDIDKDEVSQVGTMRQKSVGHVIHSEDPSTIRTAGSTNKRGSKSSRSRPQVSRKISRKDYLLSMDNQSQEAFHSLGKKELPCNASPKSSLSPSLMRNIPRLPFPKNGSVLDFVLGRKNDVGRKKLKRRTRSQLKQDLSKSNLDLDAPKSDKDR